MNEKVLTFKPQPVTLTLGEETYVLYYDLNAFIEMEKIYDSVDSVIQMIMGQNKAPDLNEVMYNGVKCAAEDITIAGVLLTDYINKVDKPKTAKHSDTLNLLWLACLHDHTIYDDDGNVIKYTISKAHLGSLVTFANLKEVNAKIVAAILRDLIPAVVNAEAEKNAQAAGPEAPTE